MESLGKKLDIETKKNVKLYLSYFALILKALQISYSD